MQEKDSIQTLEEMRTGMLCSIELPLTNSMKSDVISINAKGIYYKTRYKNIKDK